MCDFLPYLLSQILITRSLVLCTITRTYMYVQPPQYRRSWYVLVLLHTCIVHTGLRFDKHQQTDFTILFGWEPWMMALEQFSTGETFGITNHSHRHCRLVASILPSLLHGKNRKIDDTNKQNLHLCSVLLPSSLPSSHRATYHNTSS